MASDSFFVRKSFAGVNEAILNNYVKKTLPALTREYCNVDSDAEHNRKLLLTMNKYRQTAVFCDICLLAGDQEFPAHRNILAASSPFFESLLNTEMRERGQYKIPIAGVKPEVLRDILDFLYIGDISFSFERACEVIQASDYLMIARLKKLAVNYLLKEHLCFENCLNLWLCADKYHCSQLRKHSRKLVLVNFFEISTTDEFLELDVSFLHELLDCEELAANDKEVFDAIFKWIYHNTSARLDHLDQLLNNIVLENLSSDHIEQVLVKYDLEKNSDVHRSLKEHGWSYYDPIVMVGGWQKGRGGVADVNCYIPSINCWFQLSDMSIPRYRHGVTAHNSVVYVLGGSVAADDSCVECMDFKQSSITWQRLTPMCSGHIGVASTALNGYVYVSGGFCSKTLNTVQRYDTATNIWEPVSPMMQARESHCLVACVGHVYALGGSCGQDKSEILKGVERYDPEQDSWSPVTPMNCQRNGACGVQLHQKIYIMGGQLNVFSDGPIIQTNFRSCEVFDPSLDQWDLIAELKFPRSQSCAAVVGQKIYVFGGYLHGGYLDSVECYDSNEDNWTVVGKMPSKVEGAACCAVKLAGETISKFLQLKF